MIRSAPASANRSTIARASSGVPRTQRCVRASNQSSPASTLPKAVEQVVLAPLDLGLVAADQHARPSPSGSASPGRGPIASQAAASSAYFSRRRSGDDDERLNSSA